MEELKEIEKIYAEEYLDIDESLVELEKDQKKLEFKSPNLRGQDANRSSPGELLQNEAYKPPPLYGD